MALTKSAASIAIQASASNTSGSTTTSSSFLIGYGMSVVAKITNGGTGPTVPCGVTLQVSADNATFYNTDDVRTAGITASIVYVFKFDLGVGGVNGGDWAYGRLVFTGNTAQTVTVQADGSSTTAL